MVLGRGAAVVTVWPPGPVLGGPPVVSNGPPVVTTGPPVVGGRAPMIRGAPASLPSPGPRGGRGGGPRLGVAIGGPPLAPGVVLGGPALHGLGIGGGGPVSWGHRVLGVGPQLVGSYRGPGGGKAALRIAGRAGRALGSVWLGGRWGGLGGGGLRGGRRALGGRGRVRLTGGAGSYVGGRGGGGQPRLGGWLRVQVQHLEKRMYLVADTAPGT